MESTMENKKLHGIHSLLRIVYIVVPIVAGIDKFTNFLVQWKEYLNPFLLRISPFSANTFMHIVGVIEIIAGIIVLAQPRIGAYIVSAWLATISITLILSGNYLDVAVRDLVMAIGAFTLARVTELVTEEEKSRESIFASHSI